MFKEGYIWTSGEVFNLDHENVDKAQIHLTNNAIQKFTKNFGTFEDANQLSYEAVEQILKEEIDVSFKEDIIP